jgi:hypothetical protein
LSGNVYGTPAENGARVLAVPTHQGAGTYLLDADTGAVLATINNGTEFPQQAGRVYTVESPNALLPGAIIVVAEVNENVHRRCDDDVVDLRGRTGGPWSSW